MRKDLPIDILSAVEKPARYTGMEFGSIVKPESETEVSFCLAFPDTYEIGMSYLGYKILYEILNKLSGVAAERAFAPWVDMEEKMRERGLVLSSLENTRALKDPFIRNVLFQHPQHAESGRCPHPGQGTDTG